jgi:BirA family transcriptional regulator, biotin operon repressor / biotin---[acetyl-CoA-carboxylase] ligase
MSAAAVGSHGAYDGVAAESLAARFGVPVIVALESIGSTLDVAHSLAADGAPDGTLVLAETQTAGRGRAGKRWTSVPGAGIWLTLVERALDPATISLLALRLGIAAAEALQPFVDVPIGIKWPNDLYLGRRKLAGILAEARWRDGAPEWVAIGMGVNVVPPAELPDAAGLRSGASRLAVLEVLVPALRAAAARHGTLDAAELAALAARDVARGRNAVAPAAGIVEGVSPAGELLLRLPDGTVAAHRSGSLVFAEDS